MADLEKTVKIIFAGEDKIGGVIKSVGTGLDKFGSTVGAATEPLKDMTVAIAKIDAALLALAVGGMALAVKTAGQFGDEFAEITTLIDAPAAAIDQFRTQVLTYSRDSVSSITDINESLYQAISAGNAYTDSINVLGDAEKLAVATKGSLADSILLLSSTMNAYGEGTYSTTQVADIFFNTIKSGVTRIDLLTQSMAMVTPTAAALNVPLETVTAAVVALTKSGTPTAQAITQINAAMTAFIKPSSQAQDAAERLKVDFGATAIQSKGFETALWDVYKATGGNVEELSKFFGRVEGLKAALVLSGKGLEYFKTGLDDMANSAGSVDTAYQKMVDNFSLANQKMVNNIQATLIEIGTPLLDEYGELTRSLSELFKGVSIGLSDGAFDPVLDMLQEFGADVAEQISAIAEALPEALEAIEWDSFIQSIRALGTAAQDLFTDFFGDLDLTDAEDLSAAIQKVLTGIEFLVDVSTGIVEGIKPFVDILGQLADKMLNADEETKKMVGQILGLGTGTNIVAGQISNLGGVIKAFGGVMSLLAVGNILTAISNITKLGSVSVLSSASLLKFGQYAAAFGLGWTIGTVLRDNVPIIKEWGDSLGEAAYKLLHFGDDAGLAAEKQAQHTLVMGEAAVAMVRAKEAAGELPSQVEIEMDLAGYDELLKEIQNTGESIDDLPEEKIIEITTSAEPASETTKQLNTIYEVLPDGKLITVDTVANLPSVDATKKEIDEKLPEQKILEIKLQGEIDVDLERIKAQAETIQVALEWEAKVDIADIEASMEKFKVAAETTSDMFANTGDVISAMVGALGDVSGYSAIVLQKALEDESARRSELLVIQKALIQSEIELNEAKVDRLKSGEAMLKIESSGVYPELDLVLEKLVERAQAVTNAEGMNFLLGIS